VREIDRLGRFPRSTFKGQRQRPNRTDVDRRIAKRFEYDYFDGDRKHGYGGYNYAERFWTGVAEELRDAYGIGAGTRVLDVGSGKGFLLHDLKRVAPGAEVYGLDISAYGTQQSLPDVRPRVVRADATYLPYRDDTFDVVLAINTLHNLKVDRCRQAVREVERVKRPGGHSYIQVDSWYDEDQRQAFLDWMLTAETYFDTAGWKALFAECGYTGEYFWTITE